MHNNEKNIGKETRIDKKIIIFLIPILILTCLLSFYPHFKYPYLLHVDEWFHVAQAKQIALGSSINWYTGENFSLGLERAWHLMLAVIQFLFNPSITQWIFVPPLFHALAVLVLFYLVLKLFGKREALISCFLIALMPSNVTMGGPVFLMPVNLSLILVPLALLLTFNLSFRNTFFLLLITVFLLYAHPPTAIILLIILVLRFLFGRKKEARAVLLVVFLSILISIPNYLSEIQEKGLESIKFDFWIYLKGIPFIYGLLPTIFFIVGFYFLLKNRREMSLLLTSLLLIANVFLFSFIGVSYILPYQRTHIPLFLLMSIIASHGYLKLLKLKKIGLPALIVCLLITSGLAIHSNINTHYYYLIDSKEYEDFLWLKENSPPNSTVLLDPWKARAFVPIAERRVFAVMPFGPVKEKLELVNKAKDFLENGCINTSFLIENNITIVYTPFTCKNENLNKVKEKIYFFD